MSTQTQTKIRFKTTGGNFRFRSPVEYLILFTAIGIFSINSSTLKAEELRAHPSAIVFSAVEGNSLEETRSIFIFTALGTPITWHESDNAAWLNPNLQTGVTNGILRLSVNTTGLSTGIYNANVTLYSAESSIDPVIITVTLIVNPDVPVKASKWKDGIGGVMSVSVDDSQPSGYDALLSNGFSGTYVGWSETPPSFFTQYFNTGMELGSHTVNHPCHSVTDYELKYEELEPNILGLITHTPAESKDIISLVWPCGYTNYREQGIATEYFLSARGYNINQLEDATPENFMNLKSYNSHEHTPYPPSDFRTLVDEAILQEKWFNLVLHNYSNDDGATDYASSKNIWVTSIGTVIKYIIQRNGFILTDYMPDGDYISFMVSRLQVPSTASKNFEESFGNNDLTTLQIDIDDSRVVEYVTIDGENLPFTIKDTEGNRELFINAKLEPDIFKPVEIKYMDQSVISLNITGVTAYNKVYNGSTAASLNTSRATISGVLPGDDVTLISTAVSGTFVNKNAGTSKVVNIVGFALGGTDAGKYTLISPFTSANITRAPLSISGVTANNKVYDGATAATLNIGSARLSGVIGGDVVTLVSSGATGVFANKNAGSGKSVNTSGFSITGTDAANYVLTQPVITANITRATLVLSGITANSKIYNATTAATLNTGAARLSGIIGSDAVYPVTSGATGTFINKNVGTNKSVSTSGFTLSGTDAGNYTITHPSVTANITVAGLTISGLTAGNKTYNGNTIAVLNAGNAVLSGVFAGDAVALVSTGATGTFDNKNVGSRKLVRTSGFTISGSDASNYSLSQPLLIADITRASAYVQGITAINKIYDGTNIITVNSGSSYLSGILGTDDVMLYPDDITGIAANKNVATHKLVNVSGFSLEGTDAGNYSLIQPVTYTDITPATLEITGISANNRVYDGLRSTTLNTESILLRGLIAGDIVNIETASATGNFDDKNAGTRKIVNTSGFAITGPEAANYQLSLPVLTADITKAALTVSGAIAENKVYDGTTSATLNVNNAALSGIIPGDVVDLVASEAVGTFSSKDVSPLIPVTTNGFSIIGPGSSNYTIVNPTLSAGIRGRTLNIKASDILKHYNEEFIFSGTEFTSEGLIPGDPYPRVSLSSQGASSQAVVGKYGITITGTADYNYIPAFVDGTMTVAKSVLIARADDKTKVYGNENPVFSITYSGFIKNDNASVIDIKPVAITNAIASSGAGEYAIELTGGMDDYYDLTLIDGTLTVQKAPLIVTADDKTIIYGEAIPELSLSYSGFLPGEDQDVLDVIPVLVTEANPDSDAGTYDIIVSGANDSNYEYIGRNGMLNILKADQTIIFEDIPAGLRMTQEYEMKATSTSGQIVSFESSDNSIASVNGNILTIYKDGNLTIKAVQEGNINWNPAPPETQSVTTLPTFGGISSLFTPNNDGMNDYWYIPDIGNYGKMHITICNRFGQVVFQSSDYKNDWEGTWNGKQLPSASYYYVINSSTMGFIKGVVNIVR